MERAHWSLPLQPVWTGEQIRAAEQPLLEDGAGPALMRTAAHGLAREVRVLLQNRQAGVYGARVTALIGSGNNGGDGLFALAMLRTEGVDARAVLLKPRAHEQALAAFRAAGGHCVESVPADTQVLIDAVLGTGFHGEFSRPQVPGLQEALTGPQRASVIACDLPSGVDSMTGAAGSAVISADVTVTFGGLKTGLLMGPGALLSGEITTVDIGLGPHLPVPAAQLITRDYDHQYPAGASGEESMVEGLVAQLPHQARFYGPAADAHKYSRGVVHIMAGSEQYPGAAQLSVGAALSAGAGMVQLQSAAAVGQAVLRRWPETVLVTEPGSAPAAARDRAAAVVLGPGLGDAPQQLEVCEEMISHCVHHRLPCVVDASALQAVTSGLGPSVLLTPHLGEARRLADRLENHRALSDLDAGGDYQQAAQSLADQLDCHVLLKGPSTVISAPHSTSAIIHRAATPGLATAGSGDVLSGVLGSMLATQPLFSAGSEPDAGGLSLQQVAAAAVVRHSQAAQRTDPRRLGGFGASALVERLGACPIFQEQPSSSIPPHPRWSP